MLADLFSLNDSAVAQPVQCGGMLLRASELSPTLCSQQAQTCSRQLLWDFCSKQGSRCLDQHIIMMPVCANQKLSDRDHLKEVCLRASRHTFRMPCRLGSPELLT